MKHFRVGFLLRSEVLMSPRVFNWCGESAFVIITHNVPTSVHQPVGKCQPNTPAGTRRTFRSLSASRVHWLQIIRICVKHLKATLHVDLLAPARSEVVSDATIRERCGTYFTARVHLTNLPLSEEIALARNSLQIKWTKSFDNPHWHGLIKSDYSNSFDVRVVWLKIRSLRRDFYFERVPVENLLVPDFSYLYACRFSGFANNRRSLR